MRITTLRKIHPIFYRRVMALGLFFAIASIIMFSNSPAFSKPGYTFLNQLTDVHNWSIVFAFIGFGIIWAANFARYTTVRIFLGLCCGVMTCWGFALLFAAMFGKGPSLYAPLIHAFFAFYAYDLAMDPLVSGTELKDKMITDEHGL